MKRQTQVIPGYDCIRNPCGKRGCGTRGGSSHGICSDRWIYSVSDGDFAVSLTLSSGRYPDSVPQDSRHNEAEGMDLTTHVGFPYAREHALFAGNECTYVASHRCFDDESSVGGAVEILKNFGANSLEQPEAFWLALEERMRKAKATFVRMPYVRCQCCDGTGTVVPEEKRSS